MVRSCWPARPGSTCRSTGEVARYFTSCRAARLAARPDPGPVPPVVLAACLAWAAGGVLFGVAEGVADGRQVLDDPLMFAVPLGSLTAAWFLRVGSLVARRWLVALGVLILFVAVVAYFWDSPASEISMPVGLLAVLCVVAAAVLTFLPISRAYVRAAQPR